MVPADSGSGGGLEGLRPYAPFLLHSGASEFTLGSCLFSQSPSVGRRPVGGLILSSVTAASLARYPSFKNRRFCVQFSLLFWLWNRASGRHQPRADGVRAKD